MNILFHAGEEGPKDAINEVTLRGEMYGNSVEHLFFHLEKNPIVRFYNYLYYICVGSFG